MRGIVLAGGKSTRLYPITLAFSKQLLPVYDKPMIYYPISLLMLSGIQEILIITTPSDSILFQRLLGDGHEFGLQLHYQTQAEPKGIAEALLIGESFTEDQPVALALGDNLIYGHGLSQKLADAVFRATYAAKATIFASRVEDPRCYGVVTLDKDGRPLSIDEKPLHPESNLAVPGLYFYPEGATEQVKRLTPSSRGELEITALNQAYLKTKQLHAEPLGRGVAWFDMGTHESLLDAANFVEAVQRRQGLAIGCLEEIGHQQGWLADAEIQLTANRLATSSYGSYLKKQFGSL